MDLIKKFMKIGGFKTPYELEAYGEDRFFNDFPEARQYARGGYIKAQDGLWFQDPNKQALYDAETRYIEANQRGPNYNPDAAKSYGDILAMDPTAIDIRQKVDSLNNVYPYYSSSFQVVPFKGGYGKYGNRTNQGWEATQELYNKEKQKPSIIPMDFSEPKWKGTVKKAYGGMPEAFPQIATFDKAFSYGVPPGPQYLSHGGSAYPQAQTEQQFFIPIYTDVYNPYNKAMGGSNVEMYPNAKTTPHWGPSNIFFQEGGQEDGQELDRLGTLNKTGAFVNNLKTTAAKANAKNAMMSAIENVGMAKYGKQLNTYAPGGYTVNPNQRIASNVTQQMSPTSSQFTGDSMPPTYSQQLQSNNMAYLNSMGYNPNMMGMMPQGYGYNQMPMGNMNNFLPSLYNWNNPNQFMYRETGSPNWKFKTDIAGMGKRRGVSNMSLGDAWGLYSGDPAAREEALKKLNPSRITETPVGLFKRRMKRDYYWDPATQSNSTFKDWGTGTTGQKAAASATQSNQPTSASSSSNAQQGVPPMLQNNPAYNTPAQKPSVNIPGGTMPSSPQQSSGTRAPLLMPGQPGYDPYAGTSNYGPLASGFVDPSSLAGAQSTTQPDANAPLLAPGQQGYDPTVRTTTTSQAPSNATSMDPNVAAKKAAMQTPSVNQAYIDAQKAAGAAQTPFDPSKVTPPNYPGNPVIPARSMSWEGSDFLWNSFPPSSGSNYDNLLDDGRPWDQGYSTMGVYGETPNAASYISAPPYRTPVGPVVGPDGYAYGGNTGYKYGGSYKQGDVVYMSDDEIAEFVRNGGQIEEME